MSDLPPVPSIIPPPSAEARRNQNRSLLAGFAVGMGPGILCIFFSGADIGGNPGPASIMNAVLGWVVWGLFVLGMVFLIFRRTRTAGLVMALTYASAVASFFIVLLNLRAGPIFAVLIVLTLLVRRSTRKFGLAMAIGFVLSWCLYTTICGNQGPLFHS